MSGEAAYADIQYHWCPAEPETSNRFARRLNGKAS